MKERPIIFSAYDVRAILDGRKTQTRRIYKAKNGQICPSPNDLPSMQQAARLCPFGQSGDRLWARENWAWYPLDEDASCVIWRADYKPDANPPAEFGAWQSSANMPRWASRILLEVTAVLVERLQDISDEDVLAEGLKTLSKDGGRTFKTGVPDQDGLPDGDGWPWRAWEEDPRRAYKRLWESIYGSDSWAQNPWVWVIEFRRVEP